MTGPGPTGDQLAIVACGAPLAARVHEVAALAIAAGWDARVIATTAATAWIDSAELERVTGFPALVEQRQPDQPKRFGPPARVIVCPATFNTVNKLAAGIADDYAAGFLCEALATGTPIVIVPMVSTKLWGHPVWQRNLDALAAAGVTFADVQTGRAGTPAPVESGTGDQVAAKFDSAWAVALTGRPAQKSQ